MIKAVSALCFFAFPAGAQATYNCNELATQMEMNACAWQAYQAADGDLNADYKQAIAYLKKADEDFIPLGAVPCVIILRDAQRAWREAAIACFKRACLPRNKADIAGV